jgi:CelD/BcsL family acetyltransferase involved in cellulose biosynthesis
VSDLDAAAASWDAAVDATHGADPFCTSSAWSFAAGASFPTAEPPTLVEEDGAWYGSRLARGEAAVLLGLDPVWGFATPAVGPPKAAARIVARRLEHADWDVAVLTGQARGMPLTEALVAALVDRFSLHLGPEESRARADLGDGLSAWWASRSARFRQRLGQVERRAAEAGVEIVDASGLDVDELMRRVLAVEERSWKGEQGTGLSEPELAAFYRRMLTRLQPAGQVRALLARVDDADVGYIVGGVRGSTYRGFQLSQAMAAAHLSIGHLLQLEQVRGAADEGLATYDLGMAMPYKDRWADRLDTTFALIVRRS